MGFDGQDGVPVEPAQHGALRPPDVRVVPLTPRCHDVAGLALDHELVGAVAEAIQSTLAQQRFIKDRHPFVHPSVRGEDGRTAGVPFDQQIIEVRGSLAGKLLQAEIIHDE